MVGEVLKSSICMDLKLPTKCLSKYLMHNKMHNKVDCGLVATMIHIEI
jgi:hypothetical protein